MKMKRKTGKRKPKPKPKIDYPPVPTRKWVPPDERPKKEKPPPPYIKPEGITQKLKISSLKKVWNQFAVLENTAVLVGHYSQTYKKFSFKTNGYQGACNCAVACTFAFIHKMSQWTQNHLDTILDLGDALYVKSIQQESGKCLTLVPPEQVFNAFYLNRTKVLLNINVGPKVAETLPSVTDQKVKDFIKNSVQQFFKMYPSGIFSLREKYLAIWIQDDAYYTFDPTDHDENGQNWTGVPGEGVCVLYRNKNIEDMVENICNNVNAKIHNTTYEIIECTVSRITNIDTKPPETFEEFMQNEVTETTAAVGQTDDPEEVKQIDVQAEKLRSYLEKDKEEVSSRDLKFEEISPDVTDDLPPSKRPSWFQEPMEKVDKPDALFPIPRKPVPDKISFYLEILPKRMYILRGATCQTDPNFSKYKGRQGMGNAISALIMLRFHKSKLWVPRIVNAILKYGNLLYRDAMISIPRTQSLKLSNFQRKTEMECKYFYPVIKDYVVVGRLQSQDFDVVDLLPALENYLLDHECCVVLGPVIMAIWFEDGYYYWFDPNERDKDGKVITKYKVIDGETIDLDYTTGVACVIKFANIQDLVDLYMYNVEKPQKFDPFYISSVQINDYIETPVPWYSFKGIAPNKWILRGTIMQASKKFPKDSRNFQSPAISLAALATHTLSPEKDWTTETVDEILEAGDRLYNQSVKQLKTNHKFVNKMLTISEVKPTIDIKDKQATFEVGECAINGIINAKSDDELMNLQKGLDQFFEDNDLGVITSHDVSVAVWKKEGAFFYFDSHPRDDEGLATNYGTACVLRIMNLDELTKALEMNLSPGKEDFYNISWVKVYFYEVAEGVIRPPLINYTKINDDCAILRSLHSEISTKYDINCRKQTVPMCLMALGFNKLKPSKQWTKSDMDEILNKGNDFYTENMNDVLKEELLIESEIATSAPTKEAGATSAAVNEEVIEINDEEETEQPPPEEDGLIDSSNVNKQFYIGLNKMTVEFEEVAEGRIRESLIDSIKSFFEQKQTDDYYNQEAIVESKTLTVAVWRDDNVYYYFDSKPRDKEGAVIGAEDWEEYVGSISVKEEPEDKDQPVNLNETIETDETNKLVEHIKEEKIDDDEVEVYDQPEEVVHELTFEKDDNGEYAQVQGRVSQKQTTEGQEEEGLGEMEGIPFKLAPKTSSYWREQEKNGKACTMWFTKLDDLIKRIYDNISPEAAFENTFSLKSVKIANNVVLKNRLRPEDVRSDVYGGDWYDFREIEHGKWIMRGTMDLMSQIFPESNRGKQQVTASLVALAVVRIFSMGCFDNYTVDIILTYGDKLYTFLKKLRKKQLKEDLNLKLNEDEIDWLVQHENYDLKDIVKKICISKFYVDIDIEEDFVKGDINSQVEDILNVERGLKEFFGKDRYGLLQCKDLTVGIWRGEKTYYMFDGMSRGPNGVNSPIGTACITRYLDLKDMSKVFLANLPKYGKNTFAIHNITMTKDSCPREREPKELADDPKQKGVASGGFKNVIAGKCIIRGNISIANPKFTQTSQLLRAPIAVIALTMSLLHKPNTWSKPIVDDILEVGAELSDISVDELGYDFNPWEEILDIYRVKNDYNIGVVKANCEFRSRDQKGIIDNKDEQALNLRQGIEKFFEENTHGVVVTEDLTLAIWEEEEDRSGTLIYMFDPNPRGPTGMPLDTGTACVMTFVNANVAADHIIGCILDTAKKMGEFTIVPVEIVVGDMKTASKVKKNRQSEASVLPRCSKLVAAEEKRILRKIVSDERKRKAAKELQKIGRNGYYHLKNGDALIRGYRSQNSNVYSENLRNNQDITNCIVAIVMNKLVPIDTWTAKHIDLILDTGNQLYIDSYIAYGPKDKKLGLENVMRKFFFKNMEMHITVYQPIITDIFNVSVINKILNLYFQQESYCMLNYVDQWISIFTKEGFYYIFDPHERDLEGNPVKEKEEGFAVVVKFDNLNSLALKVVQNLYVDTEDGVKDFSLWLISVEKK